MNRLPRLYYPLLTLLGWLGGVGYATAQSYDDIRDRPVEMRFTITPAPNGIGFSVDTLLDASRGAVHIAEISYAAGALLVDLVVEPPGRVGRKYITDVSAALSLTHLGQAANFVATTPELGPPEITGARRYRWRWLGIAERIRPLEGTYQLTLQVSLIGRFEQFPDQQRPRFTDKKLNNHYWLAGVGAATIGASFFMESNADDDYQDYLQALTPTEADPLYRIANRRRRAYQLTRLAGGVILLADAVALAERWWRLRKRQADYDFWYARPDRRTRIRPSYDPAAAAPGLTLSYQLAK